MRTHFFTEQSEIDSVIKRCQVCYVGMTDENGMPYVLPFNFGYFDGTIFLHGAQEGKKIDILKNNPNVCIVFSTDHALNKQSEEMACSYSMHYRSVQAFGKVEFVEDYDEKITLLNHVMAMYTKKEFQYNEPSVRNVCCMKVNVERFSGKMFGHKPTDL